MNEKQLAALNILSTEDAIKTISDINSYDELKIYLSSKGVDISVDELKEVIASLAKAETGELTEDALQNVSGGAGAGAVLKACADAAWWLAKQTWKWGQKYADWEDNGCTIGGKKFCD